jgi:hypothetical protein
MGESGSEGRAGNPPEAPDPRNGSAFSSAGSSVVAVRRRGSSVKAEEGMTGTWTWRAETGVEVEVVICPRGIPRVRCFAPKGIC